MNYRNIEKLIDREKIVHNLYLQIISLDNLFAAWQEFKIGKEKKTDVIKFGLNLENNIFALHNALLNSSYKHSKYESFYITDPKLRHIHKAQVKDRILHHAIMRIIEPLFDRSFIFDSYSSRKNKGTHRAIKKCQKMAWILSKNNTRTVWILKCDISKFFDSVDRVTLMKLISEKVKDDRLIRLIKEIVFSFRKGIPLGNLTSQLFSNIYLNSLDQFVKRKLKIKCYVRYADDFVLISQDKSCLENLIIILKDFLQTNLKLDLHPKKIYLRKWGQGIDFLGYVLFPYRIILRTKTKRRMLKNIKQKNQACLDGKLGKELFRASYESYLGVLKHCRGQSLRKELISAIFNL